jgi:hypothetical protein
MTVHIDHIDSEIEIVPSPEREHGRARAPAAALPAQLGRDGLRRMVSRALEEELQEYLRIRG